MTAEIARIRPATSDDRPMRWLGLGIVIVMIGSFSAWAATAPLSSAALAPGVVIVDGYRKTVQHLEGGIVSSIDVRDGQRVVRGEALVTLDGTQAQAQLEVLRGQQTISLAREARLAAQRDGLDAIHYPPVLAEHRDDPRVSEAIAVQEQVFQVRRSAIDGEVAVHRRQIEQLRAKIDGLRAQRGGRDRLVKSYAEELGDFSALLKEGYTEKQRVRDLERRLAQSEAERGDLIAGIAEAELRIGETELKILQLNRDFQREVATELTEVQAALFELQQRIRSLEDTVARTVIRAPDDGMVLGLKVHTIGAVVPPGEPIMDIVPQDERLIVEAQVSPLDIDRVHDGQTAEIRFTAFNNRETPKLEGRLVAVSADRLVDSANPQTQPYYLARIEVDAFGVETLRQERLALVPGMPAEVLINTGERTFLQYITKPITDGIARSLIED
jgi:epimerase transport system membrane fusion protein